MSDSGKYYDLTRETKRADFFKLYPNNDDVTEIMLQLIGNKVARIKPQKILDLGTGNGYLLRELSKRNPDILKAKELIGIDSSATMIKIAKKNNDNNRIEFKVMDNNNLQFPNNHFDLVVAKAVSNISVTDIYRVIKHGGWFIYKEYGPGKGICEIMRMMSNRLIHSGDHLAKTMAQVGFSDIETRKYYVPLARTRDEVHAIIDTMRVLPKGMTRDGAHEFVNQYYKDERSKIVHSDPYLIMGKK